MPGLKNIKALAAGSNHILALDNHGVVMAWGSGQQNQLGRRIIERNKMSSLVPQGLGFPKNKVTKIACGSYHSFALDKDGNVWAWGLNNFGETGIRSGAGDDEAAVLKPAIVDALKERKITDIAGGEHHSLACSDDGKLLTWGRVDGHQVGIPLDKLNKDNTIYDERGNARILYLPTVLPGKHLIPLFRCRTGLTVPRMRERRCRCCRHGQQFCDQQGWKGLLMGFLRKLPDGPGRHR
jgi:regulator of chromosome condensation